MKIAKKMMGAGALLATAASLAVTAYGASSATPNAAEVSPDIASWTTKSQAEPNRADVARISELVQRHDDAVDTSKASTSVNFGTDGRVTVAKTAKGLLCFNASGGGIVSSEAFCSDAFVETGAAVTYSKNEGRAATLAGVIANDVTAVRVQLTDGTTQELKPEGGVIWWSSAKVGIATMSVDRAGKTQTLSDIFSAQK